jgi:hypothetical protein
LFGANLGSYRVRTPLLVGENYVGVLCVHL